MIDIDPLLAFRAILCGMAVVTLVFYSTWSTRVWREMAWLDRSARVGHALLIWAVLVGTVEAAIQQFPPGFRLIVLFISLVILTGTYLGLQFPTLRARWNAIGRGIRDHVTSW